MRSKPSHAWVKITPSTSKLMRWWKIQWYIFLVIMPSTRILFIELTETTIDKWQRAWPLMSSVHRRVVAARSVMDLRSVGASRALTYSTDRIEGERWFQTGGHSTSTVTEEQLLICSCTYYSHPSARSGWVGEWQQNHLQVCLQMSIRTWCHQTLFRK